jgi:hypothetical protein
MVLLFEKGPRRKTDMSDEINESYLPFGPEGKFIDFSLQDAFSFVFSLIAF